MFYSEVTNAPFIGRVEKGVATSVYVTEFAVIRILGLSEHLKDVSQLMGATTFCDITTQQDGKATQLVNLFCELHFASSVRQVPPLTFLDFDCIPGCI